MNDHDLLIRISEKVDRIEGWMSGVDGQLKERQCLLHTDQIKDLKEKTRCEEHGEKIKTLERIVWGSVIISLSAIVKSFWSTVTGQ